MQTNIAIIEMKPTPATKLLYIFETFNFPN
jgi:hypothetical protein